MYPALVLFVFLQSVLVFPTASASFHHQHIRRSPQHLHRTRQISLADNGISIPLSRRNPYPESVLRRRDTHTSSTPEYGTLDTSVLGFVEHDLQALANKYQNNLHTLERKFGAEEVAHVAQGAGTVEGGVEVPKLSEADVVVRKAAGQAQVVVDGQPVTNSTVLAPLASITKRLTIKRKKAVASAKKKASSAAAKKAAAAKKSAEAAKKRAALKSKAALKNKAASSRASASRASASRASASRASAASKASASSASKKAASLARLASKSAATIKTAPPAVATSASASKATPVSPSVATQRLEPFTGGTAWGGWIDVGTPPQDVYIDFDTGSSDVWLASVGCTSSICSGKVRYNPSTSSSYTNVASKSFAITYGDGSETSGPVGRESFEVAGLGVTGQYFSPVTSVSGSLGELNITGIVGLAFPSLSVMAAPPLFNTMVSQSVVSSPQFSFKLSLTKGESSLYLGGADPSLYVASSRKWYNVDPKLWFWNVTATAYVSGGKTGAGTFGAIVDTGTSFIVAPPAKAKSFYASIPGAMAVNDGGFWIVPCNAMPQVSFDFGDGQKYVVDYNLGQANSYYCWSAIMGLDVGVGSNTWLLGDTFLNNVYTTFDQGSNRVGFATLS